MNKQRVLVSVFLVVALMLGMAGMAMAGNTQNQLVDESTLTTVLKRGSLRAGFSTFVPWAMKGKSGEVVKIPKRKA